MESDNLSLERIGGYWAVLKSFGFSINYNHSECIGIKPPTTQLCVRRDIAKTKRRSSLPSNLIKKPVPKNRGKNNDSQIRKEGKLSFFALLLGIHKRKVWYILPDGKRASGPYCLQELKEQFSGTKVFGGLKIRKGKKGQEWIWGRY